jgi:1-acyl-sn-glycerol-3-phosphate acyltransferase
MFRNLYIPVERDSVKSRYETMIKCYKALDENISIAIFPEGTIPRLHNPRLISFKEGAFRMAIEKQVPIVPVTIPYNWLILPDDGKLLPRRHTMKVIIHKPVETTGLTIEDLNSLKEKTFKIIEEELKKEIKDYDKIGKPALHQPALD